MNKALQKLPALVAEELEAANAEHAQFHSLHEGYAVMLEEVEECADELKCIENALNCMWGNVKHDATVNARQCTDYLEQHALYLAAEAIQVAAMARKMKFCTERR